MISLKWYSLLSGKQRLILFGTILIMLLIITAGILSDRSSTSAETKNYTIDMSLKQIAPDLNVTGKSLARELGLPQPEKGSGKKPLKDLGVSKEKLDEVVEHLLSHKGKVLKYYLFAALFIVGLVFLLKLGRPDKASGRPEKEWYPRMPYYAALIISVAFAGFYLGKSPNPMEGAVKVFKSMAGLYPDPWIKLTAFIFFILMAIIGNKIICGWACPFGALQELIYSIPFLKKIKSRIRIPFFLTNIIRTGLFLLMITILFGLFGVKKGPVIYHDMNPFNLFDMKFSSAGIALTVIISLVLSPVFYRPFCRVICPFGLFSWLAEKISIFRVRIDRKACTNCGKCISACPLGAADGIVKGRIFSEDCFSCARCLNICPVDAIKYK